MQCFGGGVEDVMCAVAIMGKLMLKVIMVLTCPRR